MIERMLQISVLAMVLVIVAFFVAANRELGAMSAHSSRFVDEATAQIERDARLSDAEIATGGNQADRHAVHETLLASAAMPGEATRHNERLHVGLLSFDAPAGLGVPARTPMSLDVSALEKTGVLFISDAPTVWTLSGASIDQRAKLAFEGSASVTATNMPRGMLAGTRIQGLDARKVANPNGPESDERTFCNSMRAWSRHFGVDLSDVNIYRLSLRTNTPSLSVNDRGFLIADGRSRRAGTALSFCPE